VSENHWGIRENLPPFLMDEENPLACCSGNKLSTPVV